MTKETTPRTFDVAKQNAVVEIVEVSVHQAIEADKDARVVKRVWIEGHAVPKLERHEMSIDLDFELWHGDDRLGVCRKHAIKIDGEQERVAFVAEDDALRLPQNAEVTKISMRMTATTVNHFDGVDLNPQPLPP